MFSHLESVYHFDNNSLRALSWVFNSCREALLPWAPHV